MNTTFRIVVVFVAAASSTVLAACGAAPPPSTRVYTAPETSSAAPSGAAPQGAPTAPSPAPDPGSTPAPDPGSTPAPSAGSTPAPSAGSTPAPSAGSSTTSEHSWNGTPPDPDASGLDGVLLGVQFSHGPGQRIGITFEATLPGQYRTRMIGVRNLLPDDVDIESVSVSGAGFNLQADYCSHRTLAAGKSCALTLRFAPVKAGDYQGDVVVETESFSSSLGLYGSGIGRSSSPSADSTEPSTSPTSATSTDEPEVSEGPTPSGTG
jgi:hypothetical protein